MIDTNLVSSLITAITNLKSITEHQAPSGGQNAILVTQMIVTLLTPLVLALIVWIQKSSQTKIEEASNKIEMASKAAEKTAIVVEAIEKNVNSERSKMIEKLEALSNVMTDVAKENAVLREQKRADVEQANNRALIESVASKVATPVEMSEIKTLLQSMVADEVSKTSQKRPT